MTVCGYEWRAPRFEVPDSVLVSHVCFLEADEDKHPFYGEHLCACGATCGQLDPVSPATAPRGRDDAAAGAGTEEDITAQPEVP